MIRSIRGRIVFLVLAAQLLAVAGAVGLGIGYVRRALWSSFDSQLQARMISVLALVGEADENPNGLTFDGGQGNIPKGDLFYIQDVHGHAIAGSSSWMGNNIPGPRTPARGWRFHWGSTVYGAKSLIKTPILDQENQAPRLLVDVYYAMPASRTEEQIDNATRIAFAVGLLSLILSFGSTWWAVGRGMRPLTDFARQADLIEADRPQFEEPKERIRSAELVPLARALRRLATRVQAAFQRERQFLSDAAHELKTAVAIQKSTLQLLEQGKASEAEYREGIARALEDTARTERLVADMLLLSSIEHAQRSPEGLDSGGAVMKLNDSLLLAIEQLAPIAKMKLVSINFKPNGRPRVQARESDLSQLWTTLIENAIQHSPRDSKVLIEVCKTNGPAWRIQIVDFGPGISSQDLPHVFERFYRSDSSRSRQTGGFGLGLSIAKAVVEKNNGSIRIRSIPDVVTTVEVELPAPPYDSVV